MADEVAAICLRYRVTRVATDQFRSAGVVEYLRRRGLHIVAVPMTAESKTAVYHALRARVHMGGLELFDEPQLLAELRRLQTRWQAGRAQVRTPKVGDLHGDLAQSLAMAVAQLDRVGMAIPGHPVLPRALEGAAVVKDAGAAHVLNGGADPTRARRWYDRGGSLPEHW
jgi:hypothetical protein